MAAKGDAAADDISPKGTASAVVGTAPESLEPAERVAPAGDDARKRLSNQATSEIVVPPGSGREGFNSDASAYLTRAKYENTAEIKIGSLRPGTEAKVSEPGVAKDTAVLPDLKDNAEIGKVAELKAPPREVAKGNEPNLSLARQEIADLTETAAGTGPEAKAARLALFRMAMGKTSGDYVS